MHTSFQSRQLLKTLGAMLGGSVAYAVGIYLTAILNIPGTANVQIRPGVVIPIVCGALFGPLAGFMSGFLGNLVADQLLGWGWWPVWYIGNGLMGLATGLFRSPHPDYTRPATIGSVLIRAVAGIAVGMGIASISEYWVTQATWSEVFWDNFLPAFLSNLVNAVILVPLILLLYGFVRDATRYRES